MFERYTEPARRSLFFARYEASQVGSPHIEPEHLLLGVMRQSGLPSGAIRSGIAQIWAHGAPASAPGDLPFSKALKRALAHAAAEAGELAHQHIGTEHLLLGLMVDDPDSVVPDLLRKHGIDRAKALSYFADTPAEAPVDRDSLRALIDSLPQERLVGAKKMLEHMQNPRPFPPPPPFGAEGGWIGARFGAPGVPPGPMRQGRRSFCRMEDGVEVVETHHLRDGCEITLIERFRLSEDGKTLSYTYEVTGPGKSEQHTIDFNVG
jgi:hypothetical protein